jgi:hypothetical protein
MKPGEERRVRLAKIRATRVLWRCAHCDTIRRPADRTTCARCGSTTFVRRWYDQNSENSDQNPKTNATDAEPTG